MEDCYLVKCILLFCIPFPFYAIISQDPESLIGLINAPFAATFVLEMAEFILRRPYSATINEQRPINEDK